MLKSELSTKRPPLQRLDGFDSAQSYEVWSVRGAEVGDQMGCDGGMNITRWATQIMSTSVAVLSLAAFGCGLASAETEGEQQLTTQDFSVQIYNGTEYTLFPKAGLFSNIASLPDVLKPFDTVTVSATDRNYDFEFATNQDGRDAPVIQVRYSFEIRGKDGKCWGSRPCTFGSNNTFVTS